MPARERESGLQESEHKSERRARKRIREGLQGRCAQESASVCIFIGGKLWSVTVTPRIKLAFPEKVPPVDNFRDRRRFEPVQSSAGINVDICRIYRLLSGYETGGDLTGVELRGWCPVHMHWLRS